MAQGLFTDIIEKCHIFLTKEITTDNELLKGFTSLKFKIVDVDPITIECDSFPTEDNFLKLQALLQNAVKGKLDHDLGRKKYDTHGDSRDHETSLNDADQNWEVVDKNHIENELVDSFNKVCISKKNSVEKVSTADSEGNHLYDKEINSVVEDTKRYRQKHEEESVKFDSTSESINIEKIQVQNPTKTSVVKVHSDSQISSKAEKIKEDQGQDEKEMKISSSVSEKEQFKTENIIIANKHVSEEKILSKIKTKLASKEKPGDSPSLKVDAESSDSCEESTLPFSGEHQNTRQESSKPVMELKKQSGGQTEKTSYRRGANNEITHNSGSYEPMELCDQEITASSINMSKEHSKKYRDIKSPPSDKESDESSDSSGEEHLTSVTLKASTLKSAKRYFKGTENYKLLKKAKLIDNKHYDIIVSTKNEEAMDFLKKLKDFKVFEIPVKDKKDVVIDFFKKNFGMVKVYCHDNLLCIMGPGNEAKSAKSKVLSLIGNMDEDMSWSANQKQEKSLKGVSRSISEEMTRVKISEMDEPEKSKAKYGEDSSFEVKNKNVSQNFLADKPEQEGIKPKGTPTLAELERRDMEEKKKEQLTFKYDKHISQAAKEQGARPKEKLEETLPTNLWRKEQIHNPKSGRHIKNSQSDMPIFIGNFEVYIRKADITTLSVKCIVNASNKNLKHQYGVAKCISKAAGSELQAECEHYISKHKTVNVTELAVTNGGRLKASKVFHAVGPHWEDYLNKERCLADLRKTVLRCLVEATRMKMPSIALPSISSSIFKVPKEKCAESYLNAVKHFDKMITELHLNSLQEIHFVDINDEMIYTISESFTHLWEKQINFQLYQEDLNFVEKVLAESPLHNYPKLTPGIISNSKSRSKPLPRSIEKGKNYDIGRTKLVISSKSAMEFQSSIVILGDPFNALSGLSYFDATRLQKVESEKKTKKYELLISKLKAKPQISIYKVSLSSASQENIKTAFDKLKLAVANASRSTVSIVITSKILYPEETGVPGKMYPLPKHVALFSQLLYKYVEEMALEDMPKTVIVTASEEALPTILKVIDDAEDRKVTHNSMRSQASIQQADISSKSDDECPICTDYSKNLISMPCCKTSICISCKRKTKRCPFCMKVDGVLIGDQPKGYMKVKLDKNSHASGYENYGVFEISYDIPSGTQTKDHPSPGQYYYGISRTAFLPACEEGFKVLRLLRVAFLRSLIFRIGISSTTGKHDVITWNDIHHKTKLNNGSYSYPDENYLTNVQAELKNKGVTEESFTEEEKRSLSSFSKTINDICYFSDYTSQYNH